MQIYKQTNEQTNKGTRFCIKITLIIKNIFNIFRKIRTNFAFFLLKEFYLKRALYALKIIKMIEEMKSLGVLNYEIEGLF